LLEPATERRLGPVQLLRKHRDLLLNLTIRDFKLRYRGSALGFFWSLLNPLFMTIIFSLVFSYLFKSDITDYPVFILPALLLWRFFSIGTMTSLDAIASNYQLVTKIYFPRWLLVLSGSLANLIGSSLEFVACFPILVVLGMKLRLLLLLIPIVLGMVFLLVIGVAFALSALNLFYRDFSQIWEILLQAGFYLTPIFYAESIIPPRLDLLYSLNPMVRAVDTLRDATYSGTIPTPADIGIVVGAGVIVIAIGLTLFGRIERKFGEMV
jgi:lipopolysaccharide transport system permease protein